MENSEYLRKAETLVEDYVIQQFDLTYPKPDFAIYVVWFTKILQNWKALVSTDLPDGMYYEVTHNGDKRETYIDVYKRVTNVCIPDSTITF